MPLELGGAVNDPRNLWPEPDYATAAGFYLNPKDHLERTPEPARVPRADDALPGAAADRPRLGRRLPRIRLGAMDPVEIAPGLFRWQAAHPEWNAEEDWPQLVGCVLYELQERTVLIDPLIPADGREDFLAWLDGRLAGREVSILTTIRWHRRDREELARRYVPGLSEDPSPGPRSRAWNEIPKGVSGRWLKGAGEIVFWLPGAGALVTGDSVLGAGEGRLEVCPESWLEDVEVDRRGLAALLAALLELPLERVLVSHGEPVLHDGRRALARAIEETEAERPT